MTERTETAFAVAIVSRDLVYLRANGAYSELAGRAGRCLAGLHMSEVLGPRLFESVEPRLRRCLAGDVVTFQAEIPLPPGDSRRLVVTLTPCPGPDGGFDSIAVCAHDVAPLHWAEDERCRNEARLASLWRISQAGACSEKELLERALEEAIALTGSTVGHIYYYDSTQRIFTLTTWSKGVMSACRIAEPRTVHQLDAAGLWGEPVRQRRPVVLNDFSTPSAFKKGLPEGHAPLSRFLSVPVLDQGEVVAVIGVANKSSDYDEGDVRQLQLLSEAVWRHAERERLQRELRKREAQYRLLADNVSDVIWTANLSLELDYVSPSHEKLTGYSAEEALGPVHRLLTPDSFRRVTDLLADELRAVESGTAEAGRTRSIEVDVLRKDGGTLRVEVRARLLRDADGRAIGVLGVNRDITERHALQANVVQADRLASMGTLAAGIAHEINNPMSYLLHNLESATEDVTLMAEQIALLRGALVDALGSTRLRDVAGPASDLLESSTWLDVRDRLGDALMGAKRIKTVARGLGLFARVEKDDVAPADVGQAIESAISIAFNEIKYRARLIKDVSPLSPVLASEGRLSQVFLNLLINAAHAIEEGRVERNKIVVRSWQDDQAVFVEVSDTGCGIPPENVARIFDPFFTTKPPGAGSGLGLPISRNIVSAYGGTITVQSEPGRGSTFMVRLPRMEDDLVRAGRPERRTELRRSGRLLLVDDEAAIRRALRRILRHHEIVEAESGEQACEILGSDQRFDLVLCDMMMPGLSGLEVHRWLAQRHPSLAKRLVFVTGGAFTPAARSYLEEVDNIRIEKPFDPTNLQKLVAQWVEAAWRGD